MRPAPRRSPQRPERFPRQRHRGAWAAQRLDARPARPAWARCTRRTARCRGAKLCAPAIAHAREGFAVSHHYRHFATEVPAVPGRRCAQPRGVPGRAGCRCAGAGVVDPSSPTWRARWRKSPRTAPKRSIAERWQRGWPRGCGRPACWSMNAIWTHASRSSRTRSRSPIAASASPRRRRTRPASPCCRC